MKLPTLNRNHFIILGVLLFLLFVWRVGTALFSSPEIAKPIPIVRTITIGASSNDHMSSYPGEIRGKYESNLAFQTSGKIINRYVNLGDNVNKGQVLMEIDPIDVSQAYEGASAALASAEANYKLAKDNYGRFSKLYESGAVSQMVLEQYKVQFEAADATLRQARAQYNSSSNQLSYTKLVANFSGSIAAINGEIGQVVAAGTPMITIVEDGQREIKIHVPENQLDKISLGQKATVTFWALKDVSVAGHIAEIAPMADPATRTYTVKVTVDQMPADAKLGMTAKVFLDNGVSTNIQIPTNAIYQTDNTPKVWVVKDNKTVLLPVTISGYAGNNVTISNGLNNGDIIVIGGLNKLSENQEVKLEEGASK